jgi:hypothetical protein
MAKNGFSGDITDLDSKAATDGFKRPYSRLPGD